MSNTKNNTTVTSQIVKISKTSNIEYTAEAIKGFEEAYLLIENQRTALHITMKDFAALTGYGLSTCYFFKKGETRIMSADFLRKAAQAVGVKSSEIEPIIAKIVGQRTKAHRVENKQSVRAMSKVVGVRHQRLSDMERGKSKDKARNTKYVRTLNGRLAV